MDAKHAPDEVGAVARIGTDFRVEIDAAGHTLTADEPGSLGGTDAGPNPFALLYASLAACVLITIRMYASRKGWPLEGAELRVIPTRIAPGPLDSVRLELTLLGPALTADQRHRIVDIAEKCPVHRTLERPVHIETIEVPHP